MRVDDAQQELDDEQQDENVDRPVLLEDESLDEGEGSEEEHDTRTCARVTLIKDWIRRVFPVDLQSRDFHPVHVFPLHAHMPSNL